MLAESGKGNARVKLSVLSSHRRLQRIVLAALVGGYISRYEVHVVPFGNSLSEILDLSLFAFPWLAEAGQITINTPIAF